MKRLSILLSHFLIAATAAPAQHFPPADYIRNIFTKPAAPVRVPGPEALAEHIVSGKLTLDLATTIRLTLLNNTGVRIERLQYDTTKFSVERARQPFDPMFSSSFSASRALSATTSWLDGAPTLNSLSQQTRFGVSQLFVTGTRYNASFGANKSSSNSIFSTFNPYISSNLFLSLTQPLLRNRGVFANRAPILIAQRSRDQSRAALESQLSDAVVRAVNSYWSVVRGVESLKVLRKSLELADATYKQNKRALELGALPPLDIFRSESQVATRRLQVIQAEYDLKRLEEEFRQILAADLDPMYRSVELDLIEKASPSGALKTVNLDEALAQALEARPELRSAKTQLGTDDIRIQLAHNSLQPDLSLTATYSTSGRGGNRIDISGPQPVLVDRGGLMDSLRQLAGLDYPTYGFSLQLQLPVKNRAAEAEMAEAMIAKRRSLYGLRRQEQAVTLEVKNAVLQLEQAKLSIQAAKIARELSQKNLEAEQRKYELGAQTIFFVLEAQTQLSQAELSLLEAEIGYQRAITSLERATGTTLEHHNIQIDPD
jgi:outer membrane protein TolC